MNAPSRRQIPGIEPEYTIGHARQVYSAKQGAARQLRCGKSGTVSVRSEAGHLLHLTPAALWALAFPEDAPAESVERATAASRRETRGAEDRTERRMRSRVASANGSPVDPPSMMLGQLAVLRMRIGIAMIAARLGVGEATVTAWGLGVTEPDEEYRDAVDRLYVLAQAEAWGLSGEDVEGMARDIREGRGKGVRFVAWGSR